MHFLLLPRTFGNEQITVDLHVNNQPATEFDGDSPDADNEELSTVVFNVSVTKVSGSTAKILLLQPHASNFFQNILAISS